MNTNVTISDEQMEKIRTISAETGVSEAELVREAIDKLIEEKAPRTGNWREALMGIYGIWADRDDLDELFREGRAQLERRHREMFPGSS
ncbi:ribbon-helix-helix domain-containing protein [Rhizobium sp. LjRoot254]|uniref:ribbon-helix-helix domain-containing protein n=1 Tax=Rhizobium sp. LjRoot254 TaxID=3342297 RepID=UPI003ECCDFFC